MAGMRSILNAYSMKFLLLFVVLVALLARTISADGDDSSISDSSSAEGPRSSRECLLSRVPKSRCAESGEIVRCPSSWDYVCAAPLDLLRFDTIEDAKEYCVEQGGYVAGGYCNIEPGTLVVPNECCRFGR